MKALDDKISVNQDVSSLLSSTESGLPRLVSFVNPFSYRVLIESPKIIDSIDLFYSDGSLLQKLHNIFYPKSKVDRVSFDYSSIAGKVFDFAQKNALKVALVGGTSTEISQAKVNIRACHPSLNVVYSRSGFFDDEKEKGDCCDLIDKFGATILIVGMGTPIQEQFLMEAKLNCPSVKLMFTCGGFLTQTAIKADYYHPIIKKLGLRWLQRVVLHKHVRHRIIKDYPRFLVTYLYEHIAMLFLRKN